MNENTSRPGEDRRSGPITQHTALSISLGREIADGMRRDALHAAWRPGDDDHSIITGILKSAKGAKNKLSALVAGRVSTPETQPTPKSNVTSYLDSLNPERRQEEMRTFRNTRKTSGDFDIRSGRAGREGDQMILPFTPDTPTSISRKAGTGRLPRNESISRLDTLKYILEISNNRSDTQKTKGMPIMHPQRNLIESAMQVVINEAKEGELHKNLRTAISNRYGIDPNHKDWNHVKPHAAIRKYSENVYDQFGGKIDDVHGGAALDDSPSAAGGQEASETEFHERVADMHHQLTTGN